MKLFQLENNKIIIEPEILLIPEFKKIYDRDKTKTKEVAFSEFEYIYFILDWNSPYRAYNDINERKQVVKKSFIKDPKWKEDSVILDAIKQYEELTRTPLMGLIEDTNQLIEAIRKYCRTTDVANMDLGKAASMLEKLPKIIENRKKLEEMASAEKIEKSRARGNIKTAYDDN